MGLKIYNDLIGATNKGKFPAIQGSSWSSNMFQEENGGQSYMASLPGLKLERSTGIRGRVQGVYVSSVGETAIGGAPEMFAVVNGRVMRFTPDGRMSIIGSVSINNARVSFAETGGLRPFLLIADGQNLFAWNLTESYWLQIQMPPRAVGEGQVTPSFVQCVDGSIVINDVGTNYFYFSIRFPLNTEKRKVFDMSGGEVQYEPDGVTVKMVELPSESIVFLDSYQVPQYHSSYSAADNIDALAAVGDMLYVFGSGTVEVWQRGSGEYEQWLRTSYTANLSNGIEAPFSLAVNKTTLFYVGAGTSFAKGVMMANGSTYEKISPDFLDKKLLETGSQNAYGFCYSVGEHQFYVLQLPGIHKTWCWDSFSKSWHQRQSRDRLNGAEMQWRVQAIAWWKEKFYAFCGDSGVYLHGNDYWKEDNVDGDSWDMIRHRQGSVIVDELKPFILQEVAVEMNVGTVDSYEIRPELTLEISKNGGETFGNKHSVSCGLAGEYSHRVRFHLGGRNRLCVLRLTYSFPTDLVLSAASIRAVGTANMI